MRFLKWNCCSIYLALFMAVAFCALLQAQGEKERLLFYASFDKGVNADKAAGNPAGIFNGGPDWSNAGEPLKDPLFKLVPGIKGNGLLSGVDGQVVYYQAGKNINPSAWTITFWVVGLEGTNYLALQSHQQLFEMFGEGWARFYRYVPVGLWLLVSKRGPGGEEMVQTLTLPTSFDVNQWNFFALTYEKGKGASIYVNGKLAAKDAGIEAIEKPAWFRVGQSFGGSQKANRIIDEFKIYSTALAEADIAQKFLLEGKIDTEQRVVVSETDEKIVIDGTLREDEWRDATVICGLINQEQGTLADTQTRISLTYDDRYLYMAFQSDIPEEAKQIPETKLLRGILKNATLDHDANVDFDDCFGIFMIPRDPKGTLYRLYVNGIETTYEYAITPDNQVSLKWDPKWDVKSNVSLQGWVVESRIRLADLDIDRIKPDEEWKFQFFRIWKLLKDERDVWSYGGDGFGTVVFAEHEGFSVKMREFSGLTQERIDVKASLRNASKEQKTITAALAAGDTVLGSNEYALAPGEEKEFTAGGALSQIEAHMLNFEVKDKEGHPYYLQSVPYYLPQALTMTLRKYPSSKLIVVSWELRKIDKRAAELSAVIEISRKNDGTVVHSKQISPLPSLYGAVEVSTADIPLGSFDVKMSIRHDDQVLVSKTMHYEKRPLPEWFGNTLGISEKVPAPWTAMKVEDDAVSMWGRTYDYGGKLLPVQITNQGKEILSQPMALICRTSDGKIAKSSDGSAEISWKEKKPIKADFTRRQNLAGVNVTNNSYIEFDGMVWMEFEVAPLAQKTSIQELTLTIPMKKEYAHLINAYDYSLRSSGELPEGGYASGMGPRWVGDEEGGIQVFAETSHNWILKEKRKELEITNGPEEVLINVHFVDKPVVLDEPLSIALGFIVTPVKPPVPNMRDILSVSGDWFGIIKGTGTVGEYYRKAAEAHKGLVVYHLWRQGWWKTAPDYKGNPDHTGFYPMPKENLEREDYDTTKTDYGIMLYSAPYCRLQETWAASPEFAQFGDEWISDMNDVFIPNKKVSPALWKVEVTQSSRSFRDFTVWGLNKLITQGNLRAYYFDVAWPHASNNIYGGSGMVGEAGRPIPTTNFLGTRQLIRRIHTNLRQKQPDGKIFFHISGVIMPCWSFTDAMVNGENTVSLLDRKENRGYEKVLTLEQFAAEYAGQNNFGPYGVFLPQFERSGAIRTEEWKELGYGHAEYLLGLIFLHNSQLWFPAYIAAEPTVNLYYAFDENGLDSSYNYIGYWKQEAVELSEDVKASFFVSPDRKKAFMIVMNFAWQNKKLNLKLNPEKIGMAGNLNKATILYPEAKVQLAGNTLSGVTIPAKNFRLFLLQ